MGGRIFLLADDGSLEPMIESPYEAESLLQKLLADYPELLAGEQVDALNPRRWLLLKRESGVPKEEGGGSYWSLDHLFVDQDGVPTLVEVKRAANTQIRRDVVGQMLDYAANGTAYWSPEQIRSAFEHQCETKGIEPGGVLAEFLGSDSEADEFWTQVKTNLQAGRIRMVFVADEIPPELRRIVEFLNAQMDPADVLALEVQQYVGQQRRALVPRVFGVTAEAERKKSPRMGIQWDEHSFLELLSAQRGEPEADAGTRILRWAQDRDLRTKWGSGKKVGSMSPKLDLGDTTHNMFTMWTDGGVQIQFSSMDSPPFSDAGQRLELLHRLNRISGVKLKEPSIRQWPVIRLARLTGSAALKKFLETWDWFIATARSHVDKG